MRVLVLLVYFEIRPRRGLAIHAREEERGGKGEEERSFPSDSCHGVFTTGINKPRGTAARDGKQKSIGVGRPDTLLSGLFYQLRVILEFGSPFDTWLRFRQLINSQGLRTKEKK